MTIDPPPDQDMPAPTRFLTLDEVAAELNVSRSQAYALVRDRSLLAVKIGGRGQWRIERCKLKDYIAQLYIEAAGTTLGDTAEDDDDAAGRRAR